MMAAYTRRHFSWHSSIQIRGRTLCWIGYLIFSMRREMESLSSMSLSTH
nr:hypothetical protein Iba_chr03aCG20040 [Ipomoea batatas]GMC74822.1 hypothetical protein Iba_chr03cCG13700 [Ipomoea batatas]GMC78139.1 hypothetical protein Iba_chr03fCG5140 [Ipomoea batatas]